MLQEKCSIEILRSALLLKQEWRPFPPANDRAAWEAIQKSPLNYGRRTWLTGKAEILLDTPWPALPATLYMEFIRNGNRERFERLYFRRRQNLAMLVLAECMEYKNRFLDEIVNGLWLISEEATWCLPAHAIRLPVNGGYDVLPRYDRQSVDLFACQTAMVLAEASYLLREKLKALSPGLCDRLDHEILRRVVEPVETQDDFWWLEGRSNWTPWCVSNVLGAAMYVLEDKDRLVRLVYKLMGAVDRFIARYGSDGGCNEGPHYWCVAAGAMLLFLELLASRSGDRITLFDDPKIAAMGRFIVHVHLDGPWFANFADALPKVVVPRAVTYQYGMRIGAEEMKTLALLSARQWIPNHDVDPVFDMASAGQALIHMLRELFWIPSDTRPVMLPKPLRVWLSDIQVMVERGSEVPGQGLVLAAKGGHNAEGHNHNDLGQFIIMFNGSPMIVDVGVETYTRKTFSDRRYDLWCIRSSGHNVPMVNGFEQLAGRERTATQVSYTMKGNDSCLSMNLETAYPAEAGLISLRRTIAFTRGNAPAIEITDAFERRNGGNTRVEVPFFTPAVCDVAKGGRILFSSDAGSLVMEYDHRQIRIETSEMPITDGRLLANWGPRLTRLLAVYETSESTGLYRFVFRPSTCNGDDPLTRPL